MPFLRNQENPYDSKLLPNTSPADSESVQLRAFTASESGREAVKVIVVGSPKGVMNIIHTLYRLGFADVTEWSLPTPTANPGEVMRVMKRCILLD